MKNDNKLIFTICDKNVLFVPVYSMRSRITGKYNLENDGNMARILSILFQDLLKSAIVLVPEENRCEGLNVIKDKCKELSFDVEFVHTNAYGENAKQTRIEVAKFNEVLDNLDGIDYVVSEPNYLTLDLCLRKEAAEISPKIIYWCVASVTTKRKPWFVVEYAPVDIAIAEKCLTITMTKSQADELGGNSIVDSKAFYNPEIFDVKYIYFPFRLTDENYCVDIFLEAVLELLKCEYKFVVLYSDPNSSQLFDSLLSMYPNVFVKVSSEKDVYLSILKGKPIIPYLEDSDVLHISEKEFEYYDCDVIKKSDSMFIAKNGRFDSLVDALKTRLTNE